MTELERSLLALEIAWPETPELRMTAPEAVRRPARRRFALVAVAACLAVALVIAFATPASRGAILRFLHVGGITVERVDEPPPAETRALNAQLGPVISSDQARATLGVPFRIPGPHGPIHARGTFVSTVLSTPSPTLLTAFRSTGGVGILKKMTYGVTTTAWIDLADGTQALWISGGQHAVAWPDAPPRLAGNVLAWQNGEVTYRLEGAQLTRKQALDLANQIAGT